MSKAKIGRPKKNVDKTKHTAAFENDRYDVLVKIAESENRSISNMMEVIILEAIEKFEKSKGKTWR